MDVRALVDRPEVQAALAGPGTPFFLLDRARLRADWASLVAALPQVGHHYAVKALSHPLVLGVLAEAGAGFDVATTAELDAVLAAGATPDRIIHTHPHKKPRDIREALDRGVRTFVADSDAELRKLADAAQERPGVEFGVLARLSYPNPSAVVDLSSKFGLFPEEVEGYLDYALELGVRIIGFSYHVGSQNGDLAIVADSLRHSIAHLDAARLAGHPADVVDLGGGFPVEYDEPVPPIEDFVAVLAPLLDARPDIRFVSEPGRFLAAGAMSLVSSVVSTAHRPGDETDWVFIDDGLFGGYSNVLSDHVMPRILPVTGLDREVVPQTIAGPTCDSNDVVARDLPLPRLEVGDLLVSPEMGAYTWVTATTFNGIPVTPVVVLEEGIEQS